MRLFAWGLDSEKKKIFPQYRHSGLAGIASVVLVFESGNDRSLALTLKNMRTTHLILAKPE